MILCVCSCQRGATCGAAPMRPRGKMFEMHKKFALHYVSRMRHASNLGLSTEWMSTQEQQQSLMGEKGKNKYTVKSNIYEKSVAKTNTLHWVHDLCHSIQSVTPTVLCGQHANLEHATYLLTKMIFFFSIFLSLNVFLESDLFSKASNTSCFFFPPKALMPVKWTINILKFNLELCIVSVSNKGDEAPYNFLRTTFFFGVVFLCISISDPPNTFHSFCWSGEKSTVPFFSTHIEG